MDRQGHERITQVASEAGCYVAGGMDPGVLAVRYVTVRVSGQRPEILLNVLDCAGLMSNIQDEPFDAADTTEPRLEVIASSSDWLTFEDMNHS